MAVKNNENKTIFIIFVFTNPIYMETQINFSQVPFRYAVCLKRECQQADNCLRQLIEPVLPADLAHWTIVSPKYLSSLEGPCTQYRSATKVRFAKGFTGILSSLPHKQMKRVISHLMDYFGRRTYYRVRKGERLLSPEEQQNIMYILTRCGVEQAGEFDDYVEDYNW